MYGLALVEQSAGPLKRGTVYLTLGRMEDKKYVESRTEAPPAGRLACRAGRTVPLVLVPASEMPGGVSDKPLPSGVYKQWMTAAQARRTRIGSPNTLGTKGRQIHRCHHRGSRGSIPLRRGRARVRGVHLAQLREHVEGTISNTIPRGKATLGPRVGTNNHHQRSTPPKKEPKRTH